jgi:hypothetical protein
MLSNDIPQCHFLIHWLMSDKSRCVNLINSVRCLLRIFLLEDFSWSFSNYLNLVQMSANHKVLMWKYYTINLPKFGCNLPINYDHRVLTHVLSFPCPRTHKADHPSWLSWLGQCSSIIPHSDVHDINASMVYPISALFGNNNEKKDTTYLS